MLCPKCDYEMLEVDCGGITIDRCTGCGGLWFDRGEAETLSETWIAAYLDTGDPEVGSEYDDVVEVDCPRCGREMRCYFDLDQLPLRYEQCDQHGKFFDAGEFTMWASSQYL